jgi:diguanylate cyclase (GGDEF)-like protein/PAS domain S-box-containing protein
MTIDRAIDKNPPTISAKASLAEAIALVERSSSSYVLVVENDRFKGIISEREAMRLLMTGRTSTQIAIAEVINREYPTIGVKELSDLPSLLRLMQQQQSDCLPILTEGDRIYGIITRASLLEALAEESSDRIAELTETLQQTQQQIHDCRTIEEELRTNERALRLSQERLDGILSSIDDVVWSVVPYSLQLLYLNTASEKVYGRKIADFLQNIELWNEIVYPEDKERVEESINALYSTGKQEIEYRIVLPDADIRWIRVRAHLICDADGTPIRIDGITTDISERYRFQEQLRHDAFHDGLTGLANRNLSIDRLKQTIRRSQRRDDSCFAILILDLDRFKVINDSLGHTFGDRLLVAVAQRLAKSQRVGDTIARLGGDEFVILLEEIADTNEALEIADRLQQALKPPFLLDGHEIFVTASIGIVVSNPQTPIDPEQVSDLLRDADIAMYRAKARGQGDREVFDPSMHSYALKRLQLENDLRRAIARMGAPGEAHPEFSVHYQPILSLTTHQIEGFEALIRWQHPERGSISPVDFIAIAEETGLIVNIDRWVLATTCRQLCLWQEQFPDLLPLTASVNLSGKHFYQSGTIEFIDRVLQETGLDGRVLKLEITESIVIENTEAASFLISQLRERKIQVCLDDFGTGYSSLSYLHSFPFNTLKIDRSFIKQLGSEDENDEIVRAIVNLGLILGMKVVAEGVETPEQVSHLKNLNCHYGQGYWFSRPMNGKAMTEYFARVSQSSESIC